MLQLLYLALFARGHHRRDGRDHDGGRASIGGDGAPFRARAALSACGERTGESRLRRGPRSTRRLSRDCSARCRTGRRSDGGGRARREFGRRLRRWYARNARDLPWRRTRDPYEILVSELMLQQTQVSRVVDAVRRVSRAVSDAARRGARDARRGSWRRGKGSGYYARARNLHRLAREVTDGGRAAGARAAGRPAPSFAGCRASARTRPARWRRSPTSGARRWSTRTSRASSSASSRRRSTSKTHERPAGVWEIAESLLPRTGRATWTHNQALMELGRARLHGPRGALRPVPRSVALRVGGETGRGRRRSGTAMRRPIARPGGSPWIMTRDPGRSSSCSGRHHGDGLLHRDHHRPASSAGRSSVCQRRPRRRASDDIADRLAQLDTAVDTMAVEVERISEGPAVHGEGARRAPAHDAPGSACRTTRRASGRGPRRAAHLVAT